MVAVFWQKIFCIIMQVKWSILPKLGIFQQQQVISQNRDGWKLRVFLKTHQKNSSVLLSKIAPFWIPMNDFCHLKEFKKKLHFFYPAEPQHIFLVSVICSYFQLKEQLRLNVSFNPFFPFEVVFFLEELSLSLSK